QPLTGVAGIADGTAVTPAPLAGNPVLPSAGWRHRTRRRYGCGFPELRRPAVTSAAPRPEHRPARGCADLAGKYWRQFFRAALAPELVWPVAAAGPAAAPVRLRQTAPARSWHGRAPAPRRNGSGGTDFAQPYRPCVP